MIRVSRAAGVARLFLLCAALTPAALKAQDTTAPQQASAEPALLDIGEDRTTGSAQARVAVVEFGDFECPHCGEFFSGPYQQLKEKYVATGKVRYAWRHFPLPMHSHAVEAAKAAQCAARQDKFWAMHDLLLTHQQNLETADLKQYASRIGLDAAQFEQCLQSEEASRQVEQDKEKGGKLEVRGTPTLIIGTVGADGQVKVQEKMSGVPSIEEIEAVIEPLLQKE